MPRDGKLNVDVLVGGATIEEFNCNGKTYVEMNLQHATSYDCEYIDNTPHGVEKSNWPVTPFQVRVQNDSPTEHFWAELHLDGEYVDQRLVSPNRQAVTFKGFQDQGKVKEFLFALPRNQRVDDGDEVAASSRLGQLGSLTVRAFPATFSHTEDKWVDGKNSAFRQANKIEANKAAKDRGNDCMTGTAREGRTIGASDDSMSTAGHKKVNIWDKSKTLDKEVTVHYRQRHVLVRIGAIKEKEKVPSKDHFEQLLIKAREALGRSWEQHADEVVSLADQYRLHALPSPAACYAPTELAAAFLKYTPGETSVPECGGDGEAERRALERRVAPRATLHAVCPDANSVFSAAALALFGSEDLYFLLRVVAKHEAAAHAARYPPGFADALADGQARPSADVALLALANATGKHFLLHVEADGGMPLAFRPTDFEGKSKDAPMYVLARTAGAGGGGSGGQPVAVHHAVLDAATAEDVRRRRQDKVVLLHPGARKRRERPVEVID